MPEPDVDQAIAIGGSGQVDSEGQVGDANAAAEDLLRTLPGVGEKGFRIVMNKVGGVRELCELSMKETQALLGTEAGKKCHDFLHRSFTS